MNNNSSLPLGYIVAPTSQDLKNAIMYATNNAYRQICETNSDTMEWVPDNITGFPCPEGLTCNSGVCKFNEAGCLKNSYNPYFDCVRKQVSCNIENSGEICNVCNFDISDSTFITPLSPLSENAPIGCFPGDAKKQPTADDIAAKPEIADYLCQGMETDPAPYTINGIPIPCKEDADCSYNGVGGLCGTVPDKAATGVCYPSPQPYLEWRKGETLWDGEPPIDQCVMAVPEWRRWCEMPWTRPSAQGDDMKLDLGARITAHPRTKVHPPYYYNPNSGKCYVTKDYCTKPLSEGGFSVGFGKSHEYLTGLFSSCTDPKGKSYQVQEGYDCCTPLGMSIAEFFLGRTITTQMKDVISGKASVVDMMTQDAPFAALATFLSENRMKENIQLMKQDYAGKGIHCYLYNWTEEARRLYPHRHLSTGKRLGVLASELQLKYPENVIVDQHGNRLFKYNNPERFKQDSEFRRAVLALALFDNYFDNANIMQFIEKQH